MDETRRRAPFQKKTKEDIMKKYLSFSLSMLFLWLITNPGYGQTAKEILGKMIEAQGGEKTLEAIKDTTLTGTMEIIQLGVNGSMTMYQKEPNKMRIDIEVMGMVITQGYDGTIAWMTNPQTGATEEMPEKLANEMKRQALGNDSLLHPEKYGISYEAKGKEKIDEKDCFVLEQSYADGNKATLYIDSVTFLPYKSKLKTLNQMGAEVQAESLFTNYQKVEGTTVAHSLTVFQDGQEYMRMTFTKVSYNSNLEDSLFRMSK